MESYEDKIRIDEEALDIEWLEQPNKMLEMTRDMADAKMEMDRAADALDYEGSILDKKLRANPEKYGLDKVTDTVIKTAILRQASYVERKKEYLECKYEYDIAKGAVQAFEQRKSALENLVKLHGQEYFAGPRVKRDLPKERRFKEEREAKDKEQLNQNIAKKLKRKKKKNEEG